MINVHAIGPALHGSGVVALSKLAKGRQASQTHPDLEWLVVDEVWVVFIAVVVRVS